MTFFKTSNAYTKIPLTLSLLATLDDLPLDRAIPDYCCPLLSGVREYRDRETPDDAPPTGYEYLLTFPGSGYLQIAVKVKEAKPSVTDAEIKAAHGTMRASVEGFESGVIEDRGTVRPWYRAKRIYPANVSTKPGTTLATAGK